MHKYLLWSATIFLSLFGALVSAQQQGESVKRVEGIWTGFAEVRGMQVPVAFDLKRGTDGTLTAAMYSLDLGRYDASAESVTITDDSVTITMASGAGRFEGKLENAPAEKLSGALVLAAARFPAAFHRSDALPAFPRVPVTRTPDVIYDKKHGVALTLDVWQPEKPNGIGIISVVSAGWVSAHTNGAEALAIQAIGLNAFLERGYTIFSVVHGSHPYYPIPEIIEDVDRAVRFVRFHAKDYGVDPDRLGIIGGSAGGHLSLMQGTTGDDGDPEANDPVDRVSSRVQAVACFFPPTDFVRPDNPGGANGDRDPVKGLMTLFSFREYNAAANTLTKVTDEAKLQAIARDISPIYYVTTDDAPTLIVHGDKDPLVPLKHGESIVAEFKKAGVPTELIVKPGAGHGWPGLHQDFKLFADWFDRYLGKNSSA